MIKYKCKHCGDSLGEVNRVHVDEGQLGLHFLTASERESIITYESNGTMVANVVCEYCQQAIENNPELSLIPNPLQ